MACTVNTQESCLTSRRLWHMHRHCDAWAVQFEPRTETLRPKIGLKSDSRFRNYHINLCISLNDRNLQVPFWVISIPKCAQYSADNLEDNNLDDMSACTPINDKHSWQVNLYSSLELSLERFNRISIGTLFELNFTTLAWHRLQFL